MFRMGRKITGGFIGIMVMMSVAGYMGIDTPGDATWAVTHKVMSLGGLEVNRDGGQVFRGYITGTSSGDTLHFSNDSIGRQHIRLIGVEVPDKGCMAGKARRFVRRTTFNKTVRVQTDGALSAVDKFNRVQGYIYYNGSHNLNLEMVRRGYGSALVFEKRSPRLYQKFVAAEAKAKAQGRGIWRCPAYKSLQ